MQHNKHKGVAVASGIATLLSALVSAQTPPATSTAADDVVLETVVVTATKRSESQQDVASQMTALTGAALDDLHATDFGGFAAFVPG